MLLLPLPESPAYSVLTEIEGVEYELVYTYDEHRDLWRLGVNRGDVVVMGHRPLLPFVQMRPNALASTLDGVFALIAPLSTDDAYEALTGGLWGVVYGLPAEIAELADSLADLAGGTEAPVVPIDVVYPPNNAILSNPMVTFSGTGPANQLLFARGESIQVDGMGNWVWTHAFNEPSPVVVFEGESGQRATVRFSIIMQPLVINPIGEDIDGTRYVFTESVEVTGTATPNSTITVNGQPVSVDSDGYWTATVTMIEGPNTITAIGADGQFAQAEVVFFGEQSVLAMGPIVFVDTLDESTLWIDEHKTQRASSIGDPVWVVENKGTLGDLADFSSATSADRPVRRVDGITDGRIDCTSLSILPRPYSVFGSVHKHGDANGGAPMRSRTYSAGRDGDVEFFVGSVENARFRWARRDDPLENISARSVGAIVTGQEIPGDVYLIHVNADEIAEGNPDPDGQYELPKSPTRNYTAPWSITPNSVMAVAKFILFDRALSRDNAQLICKWMRAMEVTP